MKIKKILEVAGYETKVIDGVVYVHDPIYQYVRKNLVIKTWEWRIIRTYNSAWHFIDERS